MLVLEKYIIPGGSSGYYRRDGFTFDVGSSVMFGFSEKVSETRYRRLISCACALDCVANAWMFRCALHSACYSEVWVSAILVCASSDEHTDTARTLAYGVGLAAVDFMLFACFLLVNIDSFIKYRQTIHHFAFFKDTV